MFIPIGHCVCGCVCCSGHQNYATFNPSIVPAPRGLCQRCAYVASLRVDSLHQCNNLTPLLKRPTKPVAVLQAVTNRISQRSLGAWASIAEGIPLGYTPLATPPMDQAIHLRHASTAVIVAHLLRRTLGSRAQQLWLSMSICVYCNGHG